VIVFTVWYVHLTHDQILHTPFFEKDVQHAHRKILQLRIVFTHFCTVTAVCLPHNDFLLKNKHCGPLRYGFNYQLLHGLIFNLIYIWANIYLWLWSQILYISFWRDFLIFFLSIIFFLFSFFITRDWNR
jgi:hypothetical protein